MARVQQLGFRAGPNSISATGASVTIATFSLAALTAGLNTNDCVYYEILVSATSSFSYSTLAMLTVCISPQGGGTYGIGASDYKDLNTQGGSMWDSALTISQSSGNMNIVANRSSSSQSFTCIAIATSLGP